jgi:hypothetical protein
MVRTSTNFNIYYHQDEEGVLNKLDSLCLAELNYLESKLNYHTGNSINIFLNHKGGGSNIERSKVGSGEIYIESQSVYLSTRSSFNSIAYDFRSQAVEVLVDEMMYGGALQDKIKSSNLINLPEWVIPGLYHYLADKWSIHTDNKMRYLENEYGLSDFDQIPSRYKAIKGASFWKFIEHKYGDNAIPTVLYMARLTRKFNASIYYSFQTNLYDLFSDWKGYYTMAYRGDQSKPNPLEGVELDNSSLFDIYVHSRDTFFTLQSSFLGTSVYRYVYDKEFKKEKVYTLKGDESPIGIFQKSLYVSDKTLNVVLHSGSDIVIKSLEENEITEQIISLSHAYTVCSSGKYLFLATSRAFTSSIYMYTIGSGLELVLETEGFVKSISISGDVLVYISSDDRADRLMEFNLVSKVEREIIRPVHAIEQVIALGDSVYLYNSGSNGVINGKLLNANKQLSHLTNYRYNISFHQYDDDIFAEYLDRGDHSALFITDHIDRDDFFKYDSLYPTKFYASKTEKKIEQTKSNSFSRDSLLNYSFQVPVHPSTDFKSSNYDSLYYSQLKGGELKSVAIAQEFMTVSSARFQLTNNPIRAENTVYQGLYNQLLPNRVNVSIGATLTNQYHTKEVGLFYTGIVQPGARDILFTYKEKRNWNSELQLLSRKRTVFSEQFREAFHTAEGTYSISRPKFSDKVELTHSVSARYDKAEPLYFSEESIISDIRNSLLLSFSSGLGFQSSSDRHSLSVDGRLEPRFEVLTSGYSLTTDINVDYAYKISSKDKLKTRIKMGTSQGTAPTFFILGGLAGDFLVNDQNRSFSDFREPAMYTNIYGIRGFEANYRNGNTFFNMQTQYESRILEYLLKRPITAEIFANLKGRLFVDLATAFYSKGIYNKANVLNSTTVESSTKAILIEVNAYKNPFIASTGLGVSTVIYGYSLALDYAFGFEAEKFNNPILHLSLGHSF